MIWLIHTILTQYTNSHILFMLSLLQFTRLTLRLHPDSFGISVQLPMVIIPMCLHVPADGKLYQQCRHDK